MMRMYHLLHHHPLPLKAANLTFVEKSMDIYLETIGVVFIAALAWIGAKATIREVPRSWTIIYGISVCTLLAIAAARRFDVLRATPPLNWLMVGRFEFILTAAMLVALMAAILPRLQKRVSRWGMVGLAIIFLAANVMPAFIGPAIVEYQMSRLPTRLDGDGVCLQQTNYSCGPAAAVSALLHLGIDTREYEIAVLARTNPIGGTDEELLATAIEQHAAQKANGKLQATLRRIDSLKVWKKQRPETAIAIIPYDFWVDHYVAILSMDAEKTVIANPARGLTVYETEDFLNLARPTMILIRHHPQQVAITMHGAEALIQSDILADNNQIRL